MPVKSALFGLAGQPKKRLWFGNTPGANTSFNIDQLIQQSLLNNPYKEQAGSWFSSVLAPDYQAYSPEYKQQLYTTRANQLIEDVFKPQEERFAARLATSGLSGSGVAADMWANEVMKNQNRMLADLLTEIEQENINLTRADQLQALSMFPALNPLNDLFTYKGLLSQDEAMRLQAEAAKRAAKAEESKGFGSFLGGIVEGILDLIF